MSPPVPDATPPTPSFPAWGALVGLPLLVGVLLAGRGGGWHPGASLAEAPSAGGGLPSWAERLRDALPTPQGGAPVPHLPLWADELHRVLPAQPDPVLTPLAAHGCSFLALCAVAALTLMASALFLLLVARVAGMGERARFGNALACALHLKILVLALHWGADRLTSLAPAHTLATVGGPTMALLGCGVLAALLIIRSAFRAEMSQALVALGAAVLLPALIPITLPFVFAPLVPSVWA